MSYIFGNTIIYSSKKHFLEISRNFVIDLVLHITLLNNNNIKLFEFLQFPNILEDYCQLSIVGQGTHIHTLYNNNLIIKLTLISSF